MIMQRWKRSSARSKQNVFRIIKSSPTEPKRGVRSSNTSRFTTVTSACKARSRYQTPCQYETQFERVIDSEIDTAQDVDAAMEDRALLRTHLERRCSLANGRCGRLWAAHRPRAGPCRSKPKAKNPRGFGGQSPPDAFDNIVKKTKHYVSVFSGEVQAILRLPLGTGSCGNRSFSAVTASCSGLFPFWFLRVLRPGSVSNEVLKQGIQECIKHVDRIPNQKSDGQRG